MKRLFVFLLLATIPGGFASIASAQEDCIAQTWKGTIGAVPATIEFSYDGKDDDLVGRYYYRTSLVDLLLFSDGSQPDRWKEIDPKGNVTGYLTLSCKGNALSGTWSSPDGSKTLPVSAETVPAESYSSQRLADLKPTVARRESIGNFHYEIFKASGFEDVTGLRLMGDGKALADVNSALAARFTSTLDDAINCRTSGRWRQRGDHDYYYELKMSMVAWNEAFVVIGEKSSQYCGGIHPLYGAGATTYNLQTGQPEDVSQWLIDRYRNEIPKDSPLGKIIMKHYAREDPCTDSIELSGDSAWPTSTGITFLPSTSAYAETACVKEVNVPYKSLSFFLSPSGKTNVPAFQDRKRNDS